jgi:predicted enzyme related to lactoylglutathione lyase
MSHYSISHVEIPAQDPVEAAKFYTNLFGWKHEFFPALNYHRFYTESGPGGGFVELNKEIDYKTDQVRIYVLTDDIDGTLAKAEALGGKTVTSRTAIPDMGWFAVFTDPTGNPIGLVAN